MNNYFDKELILTFEVYYEKYQIICQRLIKEKSYIYLNNKISMYNSNYIEIYGNFELKVSEIFDRIVIVSDIKKVNNFRKLHDISYYTHSDIFSKIFNLIRNDNDMMFYMDSNTFTLIDDIDIDIDIYIDLYENNWNERFKTACLIRNKELANELIFRGANNINDGLKLSCYYGYEDMVNHCISLGADDFNAGLHEACTKQYENIIKLMIDKGATQINKAFKYLCCQGNLKLIKYLTQFNNINLIKGYILTFVNNHFHILNFMNQFIDIKKVMSKAYEKNNIELLSYLIEKDNIL